jgi:excisionase family DNA binding protein
VVYDLDALERRLNAGEWLLMGEVAALLGISRATVHRMLTAGVLGHRIRPGAGKRRECKPADVRAQLAERRREHRGT